MAKNLKTSAGEKTCYHCGDLCRGGSVHFDEKLFCCQGCKTVYEILNSNDLSEYYAIENEPGTKEGIDEIFSDFAFLDIDEIKQQVLSFSDDQNEAVTVNVPAIHCSSCIWLLERLNKVNPGVTRSEVNFLKKEVSVTYKKNELSLRKLAELLHAIGYRPNIVLNEADEKKADRKRDLGFITRLGISGFAFGNIMLLSFPEYFEEGMYLDKSFGSFFGYINLLLATPVFFYCASPYYSSAWKGLKHKFLNIDVPISLGIIVLFTRSTYEILAHSGAGYMDSLTGLVFFLLVGRWFQNRTYRALSFEKDYKHYFPLGVTRINTGKRETVLLKDVEKGDRLLIRSGELIPADSILVKGLARIDYSFVTGEAEPVSVNTGELLYAGGRQTGEQIEVELNKSFSQSYLMQLWKYEDKAGAKNKNLAQLVDRVSQYFTFIVLAIALASGIYWWIYDPSLMIHAISSVLIIACPCALALSIPFTYGNGLKLLEKAGIYLKDAIYIERLSQVNHVVFDKTGTITSQKNKAIMFEGQELTENERSAVKSLTAQSGHPLSRAIYDFLITQEETEVENFNEEHGKGLTGKVSGFGIKIGSAEFIGSTDQKGGTAVYIQIDGIYKGRFVIGNLYREGLKPMIEDLSKKMQVDVVTGDGDSERENLLKLFGAESQFHFNMSPMQKLDYIRTLQDGGNKVLMIGDGLNDAGAILESHVGISISDNIFGFLPSCDAILEASFFNRLSDIIRFSKSSVTIVKMSFVISFLYNLAGMYFAVQGILSPVVAAILMPLSSISVASFAILSTNYVAGNYKFYRFEKTDKNHTHS